MALQQAQRYGTPLALTLRVMSQENHDLRMTEADKKAAALPPKLTVPMILLFLPVLFIVIWGRPRSASWRPRSCNEWKRRPRDSRTGQEPVESVNGEPR